ncbi:optic atrophy 3 protein-domain-containing protein [Blastocladiella britannica]|nr:optic atrophy 3 protein-domain-containing protein [Blastocladiella britannica]
MSGAKVAYLFLRTMAKPVANAVKSYAKTHPRFSEHTIQFAQILHRMEMGLKRRVFDYKGEPVRPLSDARAVELGANFIGEATLFSLVASVVVVESTRASAAAKAKESALHARLAAAEAALADAAAHRQSLHERVDELTATLASVSSSDPQRRSMAAIDESSRNDTDRWAAPEPAPSGWRRWLR